MAQGEPNIVSATYGVEDGGVPAREAYSSSVAGDRLYMTAPVSMASLSHDHQSLEFETARMIEKSREQGWSELKDGCHDHAAGSSHDQDTQVIWSELKRWYPRRFRDDVKVELGRLIAEGGQAHIYEAKIKGVIYEWETQYNRKKCVAKVYKMEGFSLADLQRQWPLRTKDIALGRGTALGEVVFNESLGNCTGIHFGTFLEDGRFAFLMARRWGDLRTLINLSLSDNNSQEPPFSHCQALKIMRDIAWGMRELHSRGVLHRDLKSANILVRVSTNPQRYDGVKCYVADFESSMLIQGTAFWRAPEVLVELLKDPSDRNMKIWTKKVDMYSYAMICYEVLTGHVPFFGYGKIDWKRVIDGERPHLPEYIDLNLKEIVERCWHKEPSKRPTFEDIESELGDIMRKQRLQVQGDLNLLEHKN